MKNLVLAVAILAALSLPALAADNFESFIPGLTSPIERIDEPTPGDSTELDFVPRAIFVKDAGIVSIKDIDGNTITFADGELAIGVWHPMRITRVMAATTATVLIGE